MKLLLLEALHGLRSRLGPTLVAVIGLMLALTACLLVAMLADAMSRTDPTIPDPDRVVLLDMKLDTPGNPGRWTTSSPVAFGTMLKGRQVPLDLISRVIQSGMDLSIEGRQHTGMLLLADPDLVPLFGLKALSGDTRAALTQHDGIAITVDLMRKLFGELSPEQAIGRRVEERGIFYTVTAVIPDLDVRSPIGDRNPMVGNAVVLAGIESQAADNKLPEEVRTAIRWNTGWVFARLRPGGSVQPIGEWMRAAFKSNPLYAQIPADWKTGREPAYFRGITLAQLPFESDRRWQLVGALAAASALLLILAAFNCMNLQTAVLLQRRRETALRLSVGANSMHLLRLWGAEVLLSLLLAAAAALLIAWWLAPAVANWIGLSPEHSMGNPVPHSVLLGLVIVVLVLLPLTLALPAWRALRRPAAPALQGRTASEGPGGRRVRQGLLTFQLAGALLLFSLSGTIAVQQRHVLQIDRGFDTHNRLTLSVMVNPDLVPNMDPFLAALAGNPAVKHWAFSSIRPAGEIRGRMEMHVNASGHKQGLRITVVSPSFFDTYGMTILAGTPRVGSGEAHLVIDAKAARSLGFASPQAAVGQLLRGGGRTPEEEGNDVRRIVAVVNDVKLESAWAPAQPQAFLLSDKPQWDLSIHTTGDLAVSRQTVEELFKAHGPRLAYEIQSDDELYASVYLEEQQLTQVLTTVAILAIGVAMLGAYALVADTLRRRRTELVLHRLHGAGDIAIVRQVAREFTVPLLVSAAVAVSPAVWVGQKYLAGFVDRVGSGTGIALPILAAFATILIVTAVSALRHVRQALDLQPMEALR